MTQPPSARTELDQIASQYQHIPQQQSVLEPYREPILLLRAKNASYEYISDLLNQQNVAVSLATVRKFCRRHTNTIKRLRSEVDSNRKPAQPGINSLTQSAASSTPPGTPDSSSLAAPQRPALTGEPPRRGPRIARDQI